MDINEITNYLSDKINNTVDRLLIDDILDISNGLYKSYDDYVEHKQNIVKIIREHNKLCSMQYNEEHRFTYYVEPVILSEVVFYYIVNKNNLNKGEK